MDTHTLNPPLLCAAYANGYFPMPHPETEEILWYRPDPRAIIPLDHFHVSRSLLQSFKRRPWEVRLDTAFSAIMKGCANRSETWINEEIFRAYQEMFEAGIAHSVEVWLDGELAGGLYGIALGGAFFAESKFHNKTDASKIALYSLVQHLIKNKFVLLEVQFLTPHLEKFGTREISDATYQRLLQEALKIEAEF